MESHRSSLVNSPWRCSHLSGEKTRSGRKYRSAWSFRSSLQTKSDRAAATSGREVRYRAW